MECQNGKTVINLQLRLENPPGPVYRRPRPRPSPSRLRRQARREQARATADTNVALHDTAVQQADLPKPLPVDAVVQTEILPTFTVDAVVQTEVLPPTIDAAVQVEGLKIHLPHHQPAVVNLPRSESIVFTNQILSSTRSHNSSSTLITYKSSTKRRSTEDAYAERL